MRPLTWRRSVCLLISVLIGLTTCQIQNADYSGKVNVRVNQVLTNRPRGDGKVSSWSSVSSQEFARINVNINGQQIDSATFHKLRPNEAQRNARKLKRILGEHLDKAFMSIEKPDPRSDTRDLPPQKKDPDIIRQAQQVKFNFTDPAGASLRVDKQHEFMFRNWLIQMASCPVDYFWEDLGNLFWPRWVRRGRCLPTHQCSWPSGMKCRPSNSKTLKLLQWKCTHDSAMRKNKRNLAMADDPSPGKLNSRLRRRKKRKRRRGKRGRGKKRNHWEPRNHRKRKFRVRRRLIRKLSMTVSGYYCQWEIQSYVIHDQCQCSCQ